MDTLLPAGIVAASLLVVLLTSKHRRRVGIGILWVGFVAPFLFGAGSAGGPIGGTLGLAEALRFGLPLLCLVVGWGSTRARTRRIGWASVLLFTFVVWAFVSAVWSVAPTASMLKAATLLVQVLIAQVLVSRYEVLPELLGGLVAFALSLVGTVLVGALLMPERAWVSLDAVGIRRLTGVLPPVHPNMLAILGVIALLGLVTGVAPRPLLRPWLSALFAAASLVAVIAAQSRATLVVGILAVLWAMVSVARRRVSRLLPATLTLATLAAVIVLATQQVSEFLRRGQSSVELLSLTGRTEYWSHALTLWRDHPWLGLGYYSGHRIALPPVPGQAVASNLDSVWIETALDVGLLGAGLLALAVGLAWVTYWRGRRRMERNVWIFVRSAFLVLSAATFYNPSIQTLGYAAAAFSVLLIASQLVPAPPEDQSVGRPTELAHA